MLDRLLYEVARRNPLLFRRYKARHYRRYRPEDVTDPVIDVLRRDGVHVIPGFVSADEAARIGDQARPMLDKVEAGSMPGRHHHFDRYGVTRLLEADQHLDADAFFASDWIASIARGYVSADVAAYQQMVERRDRPHVVGPADVVHFDDWRPRFKAFLYLTDVGEAHAPFVYYRGSHQPAAWRHRIEYERDRHWPNGAIGNFTPHQAEPLIAPFEQITVTGSAGTLIFADTRGLHSGSPLAGGERIMLAAYYDVR